MEGGESLQHFAEHQSDQDDSVTSDLILCIAGQQEVASAWEKIARSLPLAHTGSAEKSQLNLLEDEKIIDIATSDASDRNRLVKVLQRWKTMSVEHTWDQIVASLKSCGFEDAAKQLRSRLGTITKKGKMWKQSKTKWKKR